LIVAWLVVALHPDGPYPILVLHGEQGSAKSTLTRSLRRLVDPAIPLLRTVPRDEWDLIITARNSWVITLDNLSGAAQWLSDALCRLSTGGGFSTRQLYTDDEEILFDGRRRIILNGIEDIARSPDLADRAILLTLPPLSESMGWDDDAICYAITVCALFNFYNRWVDASGVHALSDESHRQGGKRSASTGYVRK
jgi:hypothetical protein